MAEKQKNKQLAGVEGQVGQVVLNISQGELMWMARTLKTLTATFEQLLVGITAEYNFSEEDESLVFAQLDVLKDFVERVYKILFRGGKQ